MFMNFIRSLLTNRFGIILATLNVCYLFWSFDTIRPKISVVFGCMNALAMIPTAITGVLFKSFFSGLSFSTSRQIMILFFAFFITLQWLLIAHLARVIAVRISER